jgi:glucose-1-phosphate thymidylyltransferase
MKLIIPMAGRGTRLRPHSHTTPKPLLPVAGKMIVERIVETFERTLDRSIDEIVFVLGPDFGQDIKDQLTALCDRHQAEPAFCVQKTAEGTAHAVYSARDYLSGECISVFADTIFDMSGSISIGGADNIAWIKEVEDPSRFGVAVEKEGEITDFIEKPDEPVSNLALIGVYYFKEAAKVREKIEYLLDHDIRGKGDEFQLTDALDLLLKDDQLFKRATVDEWLDCGTINAWLETTSTIVEKEYVNIDENRFENTIINGPVYIGEDVNMKNCEIGPRVSIEAGCNVENSTIKNSLIQQDASLTNCKINDSTIGKHVRLKNVNQEVHVGDHSKIGIELKS